MNQSQARIKPFRTKFESVIGSCFLLLLLLCNTLTHFVIVCHAARSQRITHGRWVIHANTVVFRACKHRFQPATPYLEAAGEHVAAGLVGRHDVAAQIEFVSNV